MLSIKNLSKRFNSLSILEDFNLTVPKNGFTVLIGPSGCGKSTLFDLLTGVVEIDSGDIFWFGERVPHLRETAAYMQQKDLLLPWFSLMDNALLPARIADMDIEQSRNKALALFERLGIGGFEDYMPGEISGGMRQRGALVRTLMFERDLVLLDEPLSALDAITRRSLQSLLLMLQKDFNKSILMNTHDIEEALLLADELLVLTSPPMRIREQFTFEDEKPRSVSDHRLIEIKEYVLSRLQKDMKNEPI
ncbi:MAG: ABC transporter ATP-binding protein [Thermodesulfobacteriota bacterium]|nr:ABC transporter ATP-binding protein [Thermodesulfobacteriota bacterium]